MKYIKRITIALVIMLMLLLLGSWLYLKSISPDYNEERRLLGLNDETEVYYDTYGIPHIYANSDQDAYRTLGYIHAKDRLWQMELVRRIAPGRLSEILGTPTVKTDRFFRHLQLASTTAEAIKRYHKDVPEEIKTIVEAYIDGINEYVSSSDTPIEYKILGIEKTPFHLTDVYNVMAYMSFSFAIAHKTEPVVSYIESKYGASYLNDLDLPVDTSTELIPSYIRETELKELSLLFDEAIRGMPVPQLIGSNSWVLSPEKSTNGAVLFCNDPHIGFSQPSVWYEAHIETPTTSLYGNYLAGFPFAQVGHTPQHAIGLTMFENDDIDFYEERTDEAHPRQYYHNGEWKNMLSTTTTIDVKDQASIKLNLHSTIHGPIVTPEINAFDSTKMISMWWTYQHNPIELFEASYLLLRAKTPEEARQGAEKIAAPGLNVMYGDVEGNIAWWASAKLPIRPQHVNSKTILKGTGEDDILGYYDFSQNPQAINPPSGYVYSANNQSYQSKDLMHPGYYLSEDRARRIVQLLESQDKWSVDDAKAMLMDGKSINADEIAHLFSDYIALTPTDQWPEGIRTGVQEIQDVLSDWDGTYDNSSVAPIFFTKMMFTTLQNMMQDELGEDMFNLYNGTHLMKRSNQKLLTNTNSKWWDDISTPEIESTADIIKRSFITSYTQLADQLGTDHEQWQWSQVHTLEHAHTLGSNETLRPFFNVGPLETIAGTETINNLMYRLQGDGTYEITGGPSCRRIIDFSDVANQSWSILPTGQSGRVMSPHYKDQAEMYVRGEFRKKLMDETVIKESVTNKSVFKP